MTEKEKALIYFKNLREQKVKDYSVVFDTAPKDSVVYGAVSAEIEIYDTTIKALEQEQKAINEWCTDCKEYDHEKHCCPRFSQVIKNTVQEMHDNQWVLCSERLPEEREWIGTKKFGTTISDEVYVTLETTDGKRFCDHIRFQNGKFSLSKQTELDAIDKGIKAIAWMKLPLPYQPKDGEKE